MQGVRQLGPIEVLASAPGGSDSIVSETLLPPERLLGRKSQLGVHEPQPATDSVPASANTRTVTRGVIFKTASPDRPGCRCDHRAGAFAVQPHPREVTRVATPTVAVKLLRYQSRRLWKPQGGVSRSDRNQLHHGCRE